MRLNQFLQRATPTEADALAACWGVLPEDVLDGRRAWVQATTPGDAAGPRVVQLHDRTLTVYAHPGEPTPKWVPRFLAVRAFVDPATVAATERSTVELDDADEGLVADLHRRCSSSDLAAATPRLSADAILARGVIVDDRLVAMCSLVPTPAGPPEVSVLSSPDRRSQGLATAVERAVLGDAARRGIALVQHRTIVEDDVSIALALRCGFRIMTLEHLVRVDTTR